MSNLSKLEKNVKNVWSEKGKNWLSQLPNITDSLSNHWSLDHIKPVNNMSYNYVAKATKNGSVAKTDGPIKSVILSMRFKWRHFSKQIILTGMRW